MVDVQQSGERRPLISRKSEQDRYIEDFKKFRKEFRTLHRQQEACIRLLNVADELDDFLKNSSEIAASQDKSGVEDSSLLVVQARALEHSSGANPRGHVLNLYKRMIGQPTAAYEGNLTDEDKRKLQAELQVELPRRFKETLDSSLPQIEVLLKKFYPNDDESAIAQRESIFLRGVAKFVRLERGAAQRAVALDGMALPVGGVRDMLSTQAAKRHFVSELLTLLVQTSPLCSELSQAIGAEQVDEQMIRQLSAQYERDHIVLSSSENIRKAEYRVWLTERAAERPRVAGSPADNEDIDAIHKAHRTSNRVAGVIAFGPPGTGKTEKIIEANRRSGFDTHVISMHRHSDFAQLMGEAPVFLEGLDQSASKIQRVEAFQRMLNQPEDAIKQMFNARPELYAKLLKLTPRIALQLEAQQQTVPTEELFAPFLVELRGAVTQQLVDLFITDDKETDKDAAWANGEIQRAIDEKKMALLDEGDKASSSAFDGISAILSKRPGESVTLGGKEVEFPHWFHIDMTVNKTDLPEHIRDRFTPLEINYPTQEDLLWKLGLFLTDQQGEVDVNLNTEWQMTLFFTYIVPRIHQLYAEQHARYERKLTQDPNAKPEMYPFSMRGISTFCRRVVAGEPLDRVIEEEILLPGKLAEAGTNTHKRLLQLVAGLSRLTDQLNITGQEENQLNGVQRIVESPLYDSVAASEASHKVAADRVLTQVQVSAEQVLRLQAAQKDKEVTPSTEYRLPSGVLITQKKTSNGVTFEYSYQAGKRTSVFFSHEYGTIKAPAQILSADSTGEKLVVKVGDELVMIQPFIHKLDSEIPDDALTDVPDEVKLSKDGRFALGVATDRGTTVPVIESYSDAGRSYSFVIDGEPCRTNEVTMSEDGTVVVIEAADGKVFVVFPEREAARNPVSEHSLTVELAQKELQVAQGISEWTITGNLLWSPRSNQGFVVS